MALFLLALSLFSRPKEEEIVARDVVRGNWSVALVKLTSEGREKDDPYMLNVTITNETLDGPLFGMYMNYEIEMKFTSNLTFNFILRKDEKNVLEHTFEMKELPDKAFVSTGRLEENNLTFSINALSLGVIEISVFNTKTKEVTLYRCRKVYERRNNYIWLLPMIIPISFIIYILFIRKDQPAENNEKKKTE